MATIDERIKKLQQLKDKADKRAELKKTIDAARKQLAAMRKPKK